MINRAMAAASIRLRENSQVTSAQGGWCKFAQGPVHENLLAGLAPYFVYVCLKFVLK